jgi:hypothetical protein
MHCGAKESNGPARDTVGPEKGRESTAFDAVRTYNTYNVHNWLYHLYNKVQHLNLCMG